MNARTLRCPRRVAWLSATRRGLSQALGGLLLAGSLTGAPDRSAPATTSLGTPREQPGQIHDLRIELSPEARASLRTSPRRYVRATLQVDGQTFPDVGVRLKGSTGSFRPLDDQPGFTLDFIRFAPDRTSPLGPRIHLNNSVEDPSQLREQLGSELFQAAGIPTPRTGHARVTLPGGRSALYVLQEGGTPEFLRRAFGRGDGALFDTQDATAGLEALTAAAAEPDLSRRWERLSGVLDLDRFITFLALDVLLGHRDGYAVARNNFRIYHDPATDRLQFLPHGLDLLFTAADLPWQPRMGGPVAAAVLATPEGRRRYEARFAALFATVLQTESLTQRVHELLATLRPRVTHREWAELQKEAAELVTAIGARRKSLERQFAEPRAQVLTFEHGVAPIAGWRPVDVPEQGRLEQVVVPDIGASLHLVAGPRTAASWRARIQLPAGHYRFAGRVRTAHATARPYGRRQGAALRVAGGTQSSANVLGDTPWQPVAVEFEVHGAIAEVEVLCEFSASHGEAWFDQASLRIEQLP